jgi:hypothetical protein
MRDFRYEEDDNGERFNMWKTQTPAMTPTTRRARMKSTATERSRDQ